MRGEGPPVIVAPAGNQNTTTAQYPAAFHNTHPNVVGVGSLARNGERSEFSNYGDWVACCTEGEYVISTFINADRDDWHTEDAEPPSYPNPGTWPPKDFRGGWASWSGTSFAAPKVAGEIARLKAGGLASSLAAWNALQATGLPKGAPDMGVQLPNLLA